MGDSAVAGDTAAGGLGGRPEDRTASAQPSFLPAASLSGSPAIRVEPSLDRFQARIGRFAEYRELREHTYGALDLGTNNCRLLVARPSRRGFLVIDAFSRIIKLGEGVSYSGRLSEDAIVRTIDALKVCSAKMSRRGVTRSRLVATEACRIASNGADFVARVKHETGLTLEIIGQETEARLAVSGCASLIDKNAEYALIFDIGGGSSEFVWLNLRSGSRAKRLTVEDRLRMQDHIEAWTSLPLGVVTLAEQFGCSRAEGFQFEEMVRFVEARLTPFSEEHGLAGKIAAGATHLLGTSGTVTTIAGVYLGLSEYQRAKVDGCWLSTENIREVSRRIVGMNFDERAAEPCIGAERADLILAGCAILEAMLRIWPVRSLRVADRGLREGILATLIAEDALMATRAQRTARDAGKSGAAAVSQRYEAGSEPGALT